MNAREFIERFKKISSFEEKSQLIKDCSTQENIYRELFSRQRESWEIPELDNPYHSLLNVFENEDIFKYVELFPEENAIPAVFELTQRQPATEPCVVAEKEFFQNYMDTFTEGQLHFLNWDNVFAAGGSVMACIKPIPEIYRTNNRQRRKYFHDIAYPGSDIDLFLYGLTPEEAAKKLIEIFEAVCDANPFEVICFRSAHAITLVSQYPFRHIQIVLRLYSSPYEILAGFDVDSCAVGFNGKNVFMPPRCFNSFVSQYNLVDMTRRSPSYEMRLTKYSDRGFEVKVPFLDRSKIDPMIFEKSWNDIQGLGKLLLLEKLKTPEARYRYRELNRTKRLGRIASKTRSMVMGDEWLKARVDNMASNADASDYSTVFLPWGPKWNATKVADLMRTKDRMFNDPWVNGQRAYNLHPCFIGEMVKVLQDCFPYDPKIPEDVPEDDLEPYVRGPIEKAWIQDDPGRQMIGSFHPITDGDWSDGAYISELTTELCFAAAADDLEKMKNILESKDIDLDRKDPLGRTALHLAILSNSLDAVKLLTESGASLIVTMPDGRNPLHLCGQYGNFEITKIVVNACKEFNERQLKPKNEDEMDDGGNGSDGVMSFEDVDEIDEEKDESAKKNKEKNDAKSPDLIDFDKPDWENKFAPIHYAIIFGHIEVVRHFLDSGFKLRSVSFHEEINSYSATIQHRIIQPLLLSIHLSEWDNNLQREMVQLLILSGASASTLGGSMQTLLHQLSPLPQHSSYLKLLLELDPKVAKGLPGLDLISVSKQTPLTAAISASALENVEILLNHGAKVVIDTSICDATRRLVVAHERLIDESNRYQINALRSIYPDAVNQPIFTAVSITFAPGALTTNEFKDQLEKHYEIISFLIKNGSPVNEVVFDSSSIGAQKRNRGNYLSPFALDIVSSKIYNYEAQERRQAITKNHPTTKKESKNQYGVYRQMDSLLTVVDNKLNEETLGDFQRHILLGVKKELELYKTRQIVSDLRTEEKEKNENKEEKKRAQLILEQNKILHEHNKRLRKILLDAGAKRNQSDPMYDYSTNFPSIPTLYNSNDIQFLFTQYRLIPQSFTGSNRYFSWNNYGSTLLPNFEAENYLRLYEATWNGDIQTVNELTDEKTKNRVLVTVINSLFITPFSLALLRGHLELAKRIMEIAIEQYRVPDIEEDNGPLSKKPRLNNYDLVAASHPKSYRYDDDDDDEDYYEDVDHLQLLEDSINNAKKAKKVYQDCNVDDHLEEVIKSTTPPHILLLINSFIPYQLINDKLANEWKPNWESEFSIDLKNTSSQVSSTFTCISPLELSVLTRNFEMFRLLIQFGEMLCEKNFVPFSKENRANNKFIHGHHGNLISSFQTYPQDEIPSAFNTTYLTDEMLQNSFQRTDLYKIALLFDDIEFLDLLIELCGPPIHLAQNVLQKPHRSKTLLHDACSNGSLKIIDWIINEQYQTSFYKFIQRAPTSFRSKMVYKAGKVISTGRIEDANPLEPIHTDDAQVLSSLHLVLFGNLTSETHDGYLPLNFAVSSLQKETVELLFQRVNQLYPELWPQLINKNSIMIGTYKTKIETLLETVFKKALSGYQMEIKAFEFIDMLLAWGANPLQNVDPSTGWNYIHDLINASRPRIIEKILSHPLISQETKANMLFPDKQTENTNETLSNNHIISPFHLAASKGNITILSLLISHADAILGFDKARTITTFRNEDYSTVVHKSVESSFVKVTNTLLDFESQHTIQPNNNYSLSLLYENGSGLTPLDMAIANVSKFIRESGQIQQNPLQRRKNREISEQLILTNPDENDNTKQEDNEQVVHSVDNGDNDDEEVDDFSFTVNSSSPKVPKEKNIFDVADILECYRQIVSKAAICSAKRIIADLENVRKVAYQNAHAAANNTIGHLSKKYYDKSTTFSFPTSQINLPLSYLSTSSIVSNFPFSSNQSGGINLF